VIINDSRRTPHENNEPIYMEEEWTARPHKPLLMLYALGQYYNHKHIELSYEEVREVLKELLIEYGPPRKSYHPEQPFARLASDGIWQLNQAVDLKRLSDKQLRDAHILAGFTPEVISLLEADSSLAQSVATQILEEHFPDTWHEEILEAVGLEFQLYRRKPRDPYFRDKVLRAYEHSCAVCGFNVRLNRNLIAVEAAHIRWHQAGGPDREDNGIALCSLHHKLFDRGVFTISDQWHLLVSEEAYGTHGFEEWLMRYHGQPVRSPIRPEYAPRDMFLHWHIREVFKGKSRYIVS